MAFQVDGNGNRLNAMGQVIETSEADKQRFREAITQAWGENHPNETVPSDQTIMIVEEGDSQWAIAESAGADPVTTAYQMNEQFENPDLIHPGDVVFVDGTTTFVQTPGTPSGSEPGQTPTGGTDGELPMQGNSGMFADQIWSRVAQITQSDEGGDFGPIKNDIMNFLGSVPADQVNSVARELIFEYDWDGVGHEGAKGRDLAISSYLDMYKDVPTDQGEAVTWLIDQAEALPADQQGGMFNDIRVAVDELGLTREDLIANGVSEENLDAAGLLH